MIMEQFELLNANLRKRERKTLLFPPLIMSSDRFDFSPTDEVTVAPNGGWTDTVVLVTGEQNLSADAVDGNHVWFVHNDANAVQETEEELDTDMDIDVEMDTTGVGNVEHRRQGSIIAGIGTNAFVST